MSNPVTVLIQNFLFLHTLSPNIRNFLSALSSTISGYENARSREEGGEAVTTKTIPKQCLWVFARIRVRAYTETVGVEGEVDGLMEGGGCLWEEEKETSEGLGGGFWYMQRTVGVRTGRIAGGEGKAQSTSRATKSRRRRRAGSLINTTEFCSYSTVWNLRYAQHRDQNSPLTSHVVCRQHSNIGRAAQYLRST